MLLFIKNRWNQNKSLIEYTTFDVNSKGQNILKMYINRKYLH